MSVTVNLCKHYRANDAESGSDFDTLTILFSSKASSLTTANHQEFNLFVLHIQKNSTYKLKAYLFLTGYLRMHWSSRKGCIMW
eukprot:12880558-Ditylum_brightwellii.AAC.1